MNYCPEWVPPERALELIIDLQRGAGPPGPPDVSGLVFELKSAVFDGVVRSRQRDGQDLSADEVKSLAKQTASWRLWRGCMPEGVELCAAEIRRIWSPLATHEQASAAPAPADTPKETTKMPALSESRKWQINSDKNLQIVLKLKQAQAAIKRVYPTRPVGIRADTIVLKVLGSKERYLSDGGYGFSALKNWINGKFEPANNRGCQCPWTSKIK